MLPRPFLAAVAAATLLVAAAANDDYPVGPDSLAHDGVPRGELLKFELPDSKVFPGSAHEVSVYVPRQYDGTKPACVYVNQDGVQWSAPSVFDNLIARGELPVIIGVFVTPGVLPAAGPDALPRFNRSYEYDGLGGAYVRFLLEELLPFVETKQTADGRAIRLSHLGNDRAIGGSSSGAIAAFTAAWERPDAFSRVFSCIGTYVGLRGGDRYPGLVRKTEPKPLRLFLQDGEHDLNNSGGDWWMANQTMARALEFAGYDVKHVWGDGGHTGRQGAQLFPEAMRWLWHGWPEPVQAAAPTKNPTLAELLVPGEDWQLVGEGYGLSEGPAVNVRGEVFFTDIPKSKSYRLNAQGQPEVFIADTRRGNGQAFGPDGRLYLAASGSSQIVAYDATGHGTTVAEGFSANDLVIAHNGNLYATNPGRGANKVWLVRPDGSKTVVDAGLKFPNGVALSPDQSLLYVADYESHWVYSYQIQGDGTLANKQRYYWLHEPDTDDQSFADGIKVDRAGRLYVATRLGIQVCDQAGRVNAIIPTPNGLITNLCFGGEKFDILYATCNDKVYRRRLHVTGANSWDTPNKPPPPHL